MIVLGLETSCDETAAAIVRDDGLILSDVVASQVALHAPYGGVVPELASRAHMTNLAVVVEQALADYAPGWRGIDAIAVTQGPGLVGALLVGVQAAKAMAFCRDLPLIGVNHLIGHLLSVHVWKAPGEQGLAAPPAARVSGRVAHPYIALLVSGGHTALYEVRSATEIEQLGQTRDDAAGEAFDKVAKLMGLGYPGGPRVDKLAARGRSDAVELPRPMANSRNLEFSFSGLKTAVAQHLRKHGVPDTDDGRADLCASFQRVVVELLVNKAIKACRRRRVPRLVITGGVAANRGLRDHAAVACGEAGLELCVPPFHTCTDNAAMIAYAGACRLASGQQDDLALSVFSRSPILGAPPGSPALKRYRSQRLPRSD
ncbi:MAG: tRNA (adenosine(37)-N6)-threonylcarbamoyltransferase complex transferase subunit TsaD [Myxococcales bacterium]|nr:tRNA (adenosine(37)-N6)-threonylcarbamoyltransferase complex transferase subunit TsaD [Myxococcales bacterium]MDD9970519.1 tRNA (adenosine(37)-N6)-threonylcarbamoyltransferase complex transferase subunit TsaD [Myxococcales bacterium]